MRSFADNAYAQDVIAPLRVEHRVEFGDRTGERFGHYYNYLQYEFGQDGFSAEATHYMDEDDQVIIRAIEPHDLKSDFTQRVLVFLSMRYAAISVLGPSGPKTPLPPDVAEAVAARRAQHEASAPYSD